MTQPTPDDEQEDTPGISGKRVLLALLVIAILLQIFFVLLIYGVRKGKESLPQPHPPSVDPVPEAIE